MPNVYNIHRLKLKYFLFKNRRHIYHNVSRYRGSNRQSCVCYREEDSSGMVRMSSSYANSLSHDIRPLRELLVSRYPFATRTPCLTISVRYANSLSHDIRSLRELLVRCDADRPLLRKRLTYSIRPPMPLRNPMLPYSIQMFLRPIPLISTQSIHLIKHRILIA